MLQITKQPDKKEKRRTCPPLLSTLQGTRPTRSRSFPPARLSSSDQKMKKWSVCCNPIIRNINPLENRIESSSHQKSCNTLERTGLLPCRRGHVIVMMPSKSLLRRQATISSFVSVTIAMATSHPIHLRLEMGETIHAATPSRSAMWTAKMMNLKVARDLARGRDSARANGRWVDGSCSCFSRQYLPYYVDMIY